MPPTATQNKVKQNLLQMGCYYFPQLPISIIFKTDRHLALVVKYKPVGNIVTYFTLEEI
jgi:hypothetical protein